MAVARVSKLAAMAGGVLVAGGLWWLAPRRLRSPQPTSAYVHSRQCEPCHADLYRRYQHVGMARSFIPISRAAGRFERRTHFFHAASRRHYEMIQRDGRIFQRRYEMDSRGRQVNAFELEATHIIGSGNHARTFLHRIGSGELIQLPLTWYSQDKRWAMSPGFDSPAPADFTRLADESCLFCHNGYPESDGALAQGIDCQRCHGPGLRHIQLATSGKTTAADLRAAIVNPARLSPALAMDVCMQCHLETTSAALPAMIRRFDRQPFSYRPGEPLGAYMVHFDRPPGPGEDRFEVVGQAYRLRQSACFRKSAGRLTCTGCHDPHSVPHGEEAASYYRGKCLGCHPSVAAANHPDLAGSDCRSCHMPLRRTEDAVHVAMTDHLIRRRLPSGNPMKELQESPRTYRGPLVVYYPDLPESERDLYLGVASITASADRRTGIALLERATRAEASAKALAVLGEGYLEEGDTNAAIRMFERAVEKDAKAAKMRYNLAQALEAAGRSAEAQARYDEALRIRSPFPEAEYALANLLMKTGQTTLAHTHYENAIRERPVYAEAHNNLGNLYADQGRQEEARAQLEEALCINPAFAEAHNNLARVLAAMRQTSEALAHARRAVELRPAHAEGRYNLAQLLQAAGALDAAIAEYRRVVDLKPEFEEAHLRLGMALGDTGHLDAAIAEFREVLRLRPGHSEGRKSLDLALALKNRSSAAEAPRGK